MTDEAGRSQRVFKTAWFSRAAKKAHLSDEELCIAIQQVMLGQADDLGGGVFKKRLNKNLDRSIILARGGTYWVYQYLFAKKDRSNISDDELADFRKIAKEYAWLAEHEVDQLIYKIRWLEICHEDKQ